jgi:hypothetical protein
MKRCPECRRDYYDDSLLFCLEDGVALVQGSVSSPDKNDHALARGKLRSGRAQSDEPATAILSDPLIPPIKRFTF